MQFFSITKQPKNTLTTPTYIKIWFHERIWIIRTPRCSLTQPDGWNFVLLGWGSSTFSSPWTWLSTGTWLEAAGAGSSEEDDEEEVLEELDLGLEPLAADADDDGRFGGDGGVACTSTPPGPCGSGRSSSAITATDPPAETSERSTAVVSGSGGASSCRSSSWLSWLPSCLFIFLTSSETVFNLSRLFVPQVGKAAAALALGLALALALDLAEAFALALACRFAFAAAWQKLRLFFGRKNL